MVNITNNANSVGTLSISDVAKDDANFQVIANSLNDAVIIMDDKCKVTCWNYTSKLFGYSSVKALIRNIYQLIIPKTFCREARDRIKTSLEIFADTGMGISEDVLPKLFAPLFTTKAQGMSLGLAICKSIVEAHGGTINVKTSIEKGTTFTVTFPIEPKLQCGGD
jgi:sensor histidine kinase regulating citrate/malate metabolism